MRQRSGIRGVVALDAAGVQQYEISNFAREGSSIAAQSEVLAAGAVSRLWAGCALDVEDGGWGCAVCNTSDLDDYLCERREQTSFRLLEAAAPTRGLSRVIGRDEAFEESLFLGLADE